MNGCGNSEVSQRGTVAGLDKLGNVTVISREEGSGTRSAFAQIVGFDDAQGDKTVDGAIIAESTEKMIEKVNGESSAIGYISMGASAELSSYANSKVLTIGGVEATQDNVDKNKYPLSRSFYLAYSGKQNDLEEDFLTYVKGKGQAIVANNYVPIAKSSTFLSNQSAGEIVIHGSTSVAPLMEQLAEEYMSINTHAKITVEASDSTQGLTDAMQGKCDLGMSSRDLKDYEKELLDYDIIAKDGIMVIISSDNPLEDVTLNELYSIYTGEVTRWEELNGTN